MKYFTLTPFPWLPDLNSQKASQKNNDLNFLKVGYNMQVAYNMQVTHNMQVAYNMQVACRKAHLLPLEDVYPSLKLNLLS